MRYRPQRPFPPYAYLPGRDPHPTRDADGHSYSDEPETPAAYFAPQQWSANADYLYGVDLYNHAYLWEAHEAWEGLWHAAKHDPYQAEFLQGLIQCAAAALKIAMEQPKGLARLSELGTARLVNVATSATPVFMGLDVMDFVSSFRAFAASAPQSADERPQIELDYS